MLGEYRVDSVLGEGGMGVVFRGEQLLIKKPVAIKVLRRTLAADASFAARLLDEARVVNAIQHLAIISAFGFGQTPDGRPYMVMELVQGEPLDARLSEKGRQSLLEALTLLNAILAPLEAAHASGVIHRDLKPSNVFIQRLPDGTDFPRLLDFGLASYAGSRTGLGIAGTPAYMAPEQARPGPITPAVDLYAVGCLAYELLTGRPPFDDADVGVVLEHHVSSKPRPLTALRLDLDDEISDFVSELLAKDPSKRPSAGQARRDVSRMLRAHAEATTVGERRKKQEGPSLTATSAPELRTTPFTPLGVSPGDPQDANTMRQLDAVTSQPPREPSGETTVTEVAAAVPPTHADLPAVEPATDRWLWPVVIVAALVLIALLVLVLKS